MKPTIGLFLLRNRVPIGLAILFGVVVYLLGGWELLLVIPFSVAATLGVMLLLGYFNDW